MISQFFKRSLIVLRRILNKFRHVFRGQISRKNEIGRWIELISSLSGTHVIVEIGTWNGRGSSRLICDGVKMNSHEVSVIGLEVNNKMFKKARKHLSRYPFFSVINGSIISEEELDDSDLQDFEREWLAEDKNSLRKSPNVLDLMPQTIDLLILDGGEFSSYREFMLLKERVTGWIIIDDVDVRKGNRILREIEDIEDFALIHRSRERHGTAILLRIS